jgi:hypothetical protein
VERTEELLQANKSLKEIVELNTWPEHFETMRNPDILAGLYSQNRNANLRDLKTVVSPLMCRSHYPELEKRLVAIIKQRRAKGGYVSRLFVVRQYVQANLRTMLNTEIPDKLNLTLSGVGFLPVADLT